LRLIWLDHAEKLNTFYLEQDMTNAAIFVNEKIQQLSPIEEKSYFNLMKLYYLLNNTVVVEAHYEKIMMMTKEHLDAAPSEGITAWYEHWKIKV